MKKKDWIFLVFAVLGSGVIGCLTSTTYASDFCDAVRYGELYAEDGTFLGALTNNEYDPLSIANKFGKYGSEFQITSIFNEFGEYGSEFQNYSPWNEFSSSGPRIYKGDGYWRLTLNEFVQGGLNTFDVLTCFISPGDNRLKPYWKLHKDKANSFSNTTMFTEENLCQQEFGGNTTNGTEKGTCICKIGYKWASDRKSCVALSPDESCKIQYGDYSVSDGNGYCVCQKGFSFQNLGGEKICVENPKKSCMDSFGPNTVEVGDRCYCKEGYVWNNNKNWCVWPKYKYVADGSAYINALLDEQQAEEKNEVLQKLENKETKKEAELAKSSLGSKASIIEGLVPVIKSKDSETQQKVSLILESFKVSSDEYTRSVGFYLSYLLG